MRVKIFSSGYADDSLQQAINKWIEREKPLVKEISQSESGDSENFNITISIWYEPKKSAGTF